MMTPEEKEALARAKTITDLQEAHGAFLRAQVSMRRMRSQINGIENIDIDGLTHSLSILEAVDEQVIAEYGRRTMQRDRLPSVLDRIREHQERP